MFGGRMRTEPELAADLKMSKPGSLQAAAVPPLGPRRVDQPAPPVIDPARDAGPVGDDDPVTPHLNHRVMARLIRRRGCTRSKAGASRPAG